VRFFKYFLLFFLFAVFGFQIAQQSFSVFPKQPLNDVYDTTKLPVYSKDIYFNGQYQPGLEKYLEEKMGFRGILIRMRNQLDYSLFGYTANPDIIIGKGGMLFMGANIRNYSGCYLVDENQVKNNIKRLKLIQDDLEKHNVGFLLIFAPGKATYYAERIPDNYWIRPVNNYKNYIKALSGSGLNFIDMNAWFLKMKGKTKYPLYPLNGSHWNSYGIYLAADSMFRYIEKLKKIDLPEFWFDKVTMSDSMRFKDNDIGKLLNLTYPLKQEKMPYFHFCYNKEGKTRPKVLSIGDSYWLGFSQTGITENVFSDDHLWYYFKVDVINDNSHGDLVKSNIKNMLYKQDMVILIATESNFFDFPFGFVDSFFEQCLPSSAEAIDIKLENCINMIKSNKKWYDLIVEKARKNGRTVDDQLRRDAQYTLDQLNKK